MKKYSLLFLNVLMLVLSIIFLDNIENYFAKNGFSWTTSNILPHVINLIFIITLAINISNLSFPKNQIKRSISNISIIVLLIVISLSANKIYKSDFVLNYHKTENIKLDNISETKFAIITIPGCGFCNQAISELTEMKNRNKNLDFQIIILSPNPNDTIEFYNLSNGKFPIHLSEDFAKYEKLTKYSYPTFIELKNKNVINRWSNNDMGPRLKDYFENN